MKYYGIKKQIRHQKITNWYAKTSSRFKAFVPCRHHKFFIDHYQYIIKENHSFKNDNNSIPESHWLELNQIVTSDLIYREDIKILQNGIRKLIKKHWAGDRFLGQPVKGLNEIYEIIDNMDSNMLLWYNSCDCGFFDFRGEHLESTIDHFSLRIKNVNSSYLSLEFGVFLTQEKKNELEKIINEDYHNTQGYATKTLISAKNGGAFNSYTIVHYNDEFLKSDRISNWIGCIEWEFYNALQKYFPLVLHNQGLIPPRIEVFYTDIDYHDDNRYFWQSVGIASYQGQFIDERQKVFFDYTKSQIDEWPYPRLIYLIKDDGINPGQFKSVKDDVYFHMKDYAIDYFRFLFLRILSREAGKTVIKLKHRLDKIKLKRNRLKDVLKLRYTFERDIDPYIRYERDNPFDNSIMKLEKVYNDSDEILINASRKQNKTYKDFCKGVVSGAALIDKSITAIHDEFEDKEHILQHLSDYKYSMKNWILNVIMLFIAAVTLFL